MQTQQLSHLAELLPEIERLPQEWALVACGDNKGPQYENWGQISLKFADFRECVESGVLERAQHNGRPITCDRIRAVGVLCGEPSGGLLFFDHDGPSCPGLILELSQAESLSDALPKTVAVTSGRKGRYQLIYRVPEIYWQGIATHKAKTGETGDDGKPEQVEFRWNGCQSVVVGYHPQTGGYQWKYHPVDVEIAIAPQWMVAQMLKPEAAAPERSSSRVPLLERVDLSDAEWALSYLKSIPPTEDYETWLSVGMALHSVDSGLLQEWDNWSSGAQNYKPGVCDKKWKSFKRSGSGIGTLGYLAKQNGWKAPDVARPFTGERIGAKLAPSPTGERVTVFKQAVANFRTITDPFERALAENEIGETFKIRGHRLENLAALQESQTDSEAVCSISDITCELFELIEQRSLTGIDPGITCGFYDLDMMTNGFGRGDLIIIAGRPSMGKSCLAMGMMRQIAAFYGHPVVVFSLEMSKEQLVSRLVSVESQIPTGRLRAGRINENEWERLSAAMSSIAQLPIFIDETVNITVEMIADRCYRLAKTHGQLGAIAVDYLQIMDGLGENRVQELSRIARKLKALARELNCPVFGLSQLSRAVESRQVKRPMMSDLRDSGGIEQDADLILMLYRDSYYNQDSPDRGIAEVIIAKHRNGPTGTIKLLFDEEFVHFRNLARRN